MSTDEKMEQELINNYKAFQKLLPELEPTDAGKYALMRKGKLSQIFDSPGDAMKFAEEKYTDGLYSIQQITDRVVELGYFSHAVHLGSV